MQAENQSLASPLGLLAFCASFAALLLALSSSSARAADCPNEAIRTEQGVSSLALSDCRAYELVSPGSIPSLTAGSALGFGGGKASPEGDALSYFSRYPGLGAKTSSETWLSQRVATGWTVKSLDPQLTPSPTTKGICQPGVSLSEGLDSYLFSAGGELYSPGIPSPSGECGKPAEELVPGEPRGYSNLYLRRGDAPYVLVNPVPSGVNPANATYQAASSDLSRVVFSEDAQLTPDSPSGFNLFEWADGIVRLIGVLPNGETVPATLGAATENWGAGGGGKFLGLAPVSHAVSADGERVFFEANGDLYLRENAGQAPALDANCLTTDEPDLACTLQLDRSVGAGSDGGGVFQFASRNGDRVFFTSDHALTFPASAKAGKPDLYEYDINTNKLTNLTAIGSVEAANVRGISGGSDDGSHLYFVARGVLTGSEQNGQGEVAQANQPNLYLAREGTLIYVVTLAPWEEGGVFGGKDRSNWWEAAVGRLKTAWSPSGKYLLFPSVKSLTGFDNAPAEPGVCGLGVTACEELFLYNAEEEGLSCVSCDSSGASPVASTSLVERQEFQRFGPGPRYMPRAVLDSGQVFFDTANPLTPRDVNGFLDVYQYRSGSLDLISSGTAEGGSVFVDAGADGSDIFFVTPEALIRGDGDGGLPSIYDARIGGGFAEPPLPPAPCGGDESCRANLAPPTLVAPPFTAAFTGAGNVRPRLCKHSKVRRGGRCVKRVKRHHRKHRSGQRRSRGEK